MTNIEKLCKEVERVMGREIVQHGDFEALAKRVTERMGERLSPTTLKRVWGYLNDEVQPRRMTLNVLARFAGYKDFEGLCRSDGRRDSDPILARHIIGHELEEGQRVRLCWRPDRVCVIRHDGGGRFTVVEAVNTKISVGDTFDCHLIVECEPLYLSNLTHNGTTGHLYVAGREGGVLFEVLRE